jgi:glycosyltransferase involved in cell wall biosynthesis
LLVAGNDRDVSGYTRMARRFGVGDRVSFLGSHSRVEDLFRAADVMALPSLFEPFGNVVMEAMACGLPALTSAQSGVAELMPPAMRPYIVNDPSDPFEIWARLDALIEARGELAKLARPIVEPFTWKRHAEDLLKMLERVR